MLYLLQFVMGVLLIFSFMGYMQFVRKALSIRWEFIPVFVFSSIACIVFLSGLVGQLYIGSLVLLLVGLLLYGGMVFLGMRRGASFRISFSLFQFSFLAGTFIFLLVLFQNELTHYDNFSHWAIVLKQMLSTDTFPTPDSNLIDFKNYPLGTSSFIYYVCRFMGHSQSVMLLAQGLLIFSCFYAMFGIVSEKKRFLLYAFLGLGLSTLSFFNLTIRITNLLVDFLLPIYALAILAVIYQYRHDIKRACIIMLPLAGVLTVIKSTGIIFAAISLIFLVYTWLKHKQKFSWKTALAVIGTICGSLIPYFGWSWRMATVFQGVDNKFDVATSGIQSGKTAEQMHEILWLFLKSSTDITTRPVIGIVIFEIVAIAASIFAYVVLKKKWNLWKALIALDVVLLLYYAGILALYLFSMPMDEAIVLAGFERYASSIVVLFAGGLVLCAAIDLERSFHYRIGEVPDYQAFKTVETKGHYQKGIIGCMAIAATILLSEYNGIVSIAKTYDTTLPYKIHAVTGDRWYKDGQEDNNRYLFYASDRDQQVTNYYMQYVGKYFLYAPHVDGIVLFYEDNMDNLLSGYDYLVVVETDRNAKWLLKKHYGIDMQEGIYKITRSGEQIILTLT
ncbi:MULTISPECIES: hypothetical protein [unclassified Paenibacillus]|uniref:hypothetical protein n=2 Tax=Paenibacillus TaxID=44249 RepID=UPI0009A6C58C|nr:MULTISPECIES: hypothetical protein [unclassified Paenibacillus]SLK17416.1 hypothetical protein SAMN06272722_11195 [Paenibacillus sp. RU5A]SOC74766.1 hypothetical protein SAMN05880581_11195 [Paenibacillus sp. RU26A]SOC76883.1 hypothetical protein SAMN05880586_11195 [Paenibacillus sp. RU5M]